MSLPDDEAERVPAKPCAGCHGDAAGEVWGHQLCHACCADWHDAAVAAKADPGPAASVELITAAFVKFTGEWVAGRARGAA